MIGIYKITNPKNKIYIGQSIDIIKRFKTYRSLGKNVVGQIKLYRSLKKYGVEKHKFEIICECDLIDLNNKERYYQDLYSVLKNGLNLNLVNTSTQRKVMSQETRIKLSKATTGRFKGIKLSEEHKEKLRGKRNLSVESRLRMANNNLGRKLSKETKLKMRESNNNKKIVLDIVTGIFYNCSTEAEEAYNIPKNTLARKLNGLRKNKTNLIYA